MMIITQGKTRRGMIKLWATRIRFIGNLTSKGGNTKSAHAVLGTRMDGLMMKDILHQFLGGDGAVIMELMLPYYIGLGCKMTRVSR